MTSDRDRKFYVSSIGDLYMKSLEMFPGKIVTGDGKTLDPRSMEINDTGFVEFQGPTTITRTSFTRIE